MVDGKNKPVKVAFLFGAGAEGKGNHGLCSGQGYLQNTFFSESDLRRMTYALKKLFNEKYFCKKDKDTSWSYSEALLQNRTVMSFILRRIIVKRLNERYEFEDKYKDVISIAITRDDITDLMDKDLRARRKGLNNDEKADIGEEIKKIEAELKEVFEGKKGVNEVNSPFLKELLGTKNSSDYSDLLNTGLVGLLDQYFHTIANPVRYSRSSFARIFNYYWACYFTILNDVLRWLLGSEENNERFRGIKVLKQINSQSELKLDYIEILQNPQKLTEYLYGPELPLQQEGSYYDLISKELNKKTTELTCVGVATTNYYRFCEVVHGAPIYLNGSLNLFEFPETLEVLDARDDSDSVDLSGKKLFFPFIFGQSMVKPIVHSKQTEEFHRFKEMLKEASVLVVLGYGINEDDNHINAFLHEFLENGKSLICVTSETEKAVQTRLRFTEGSAASKRIACISYEKGNEETVKEIFKRIRFETTSEEKSDAAVAASNMANGKGELT